MEEVIERNKKRARIEIDEEKVDVCYPKKDKYDKENL